MQLLVHGEKMDENEFERLLAICRIRLSEKEKPLIKNDIEEVLEYFNMLDSVDAKGRVAYQPVEVEGVMRDDNVEAFGNVAGMLKNAKTFRFYVVGPKI